MKKAFLVVLMLSSSLIFAQHTISGSVSDESYNLPLIVDDPSKNTQAFQKKEEGDKQDSDSDNSNNISADEKLKDFLDGATFDNPLYIGVKARLLENLWDKKASYHIKSRSIQ